MTDSRKRCDEEASRARWEASGCVVGSGAGAPSPASEADATSVKSAAHRVPRAARVFDALDVWIFRSEDVPVLIMLCVLRTRVACRAR
jgi:hypothetical protein